MAIDRGSNFECWLLPRSEPPATWRFYSGRPVAELLAKVAYVRIDAHSKVVFSTGIVVSRTTPAMTQPTWWGQFIRSSEELLRRSREISGPSASGRRIFVSARDLRLGSTYEAVVELADDGSVSVGSLNTDLPEDRSSRTTFRCVVILEPQDPGGWRAILQLHLRTEGSRSAADLAVRVLTWFHGLHPLDERARFAGPKQIPRVDPDRATVQIEPQTPELCTSLVDAYLEGVFKGNPGPSTRLTAEFTAKLQQPASSGRLEGLVREAQQAGWRPSHMYFSNQALGLLVLELAVEGRLSGVDEHAWEASPATIAAASTLATDPAPGQRAARLSRVLRLVEEWVSRARRSGASALTIRSEISRSSSQELSEVLKYAPWLALHAEMSPYLPRLAGELPEVLETLRHGWAGLRLAAAARGRGIQFRADNVARNRLKFVFPGLEAALPQQDEELKFALAQLREDDLLGAASALRSLENPAPLTQQILKLLQDKAPYQAHNGSLGLLCDFVDRKTVIAVINLDPAADVSVQMPGLTTRLDAFLPDTVGAVGYWVEAEERDQALDIVTDGKETIRVLGRERPRLKWSGLLTDSNIAAEDFCGRQEQLDEIRGTFGDADHPSVCVVISGPRRAGKTTLAKRAATLEAAHQGIGPLVIDLGTDIELQDPTRVNRLACRFLALELEDCLMDSVARDFDADSLNKDNLADALIDLDRWLARRSLKLTILLDEFDVLFAQTVEPALRDTARRIASRSWKSLNILLTVQRFSASAAELKTAHAIHCRPMLTWRDALRYFSAIDHVRDGVHALERVVASPRTFKDSIEPLVGYRPYWWGQMRQALEEAVRGDEGRPRLVGSDTVHGAQRRLLDAAPLKLVLKASGDMPSISDRLQDTYSVSEKRLLVQVAQRSALLVAEAQRVGGEGLNELLDRYVLELTHGGRQVRIAEPMMAEFVRAHTYELEEQIRDLE